MDINRRTVLLGVTLLLLPRTAGAESALEREHRPKLDIPTLSEDPMAVPVQAWVDHPMEPDHFIRSLEITLDRDPVPAKGKFLFGPASGHAWVAFKMRSGVGGVVKAVAECSRHGAFTATREIRVAEGGCSTPPETLVRERPRNPQLRLPESIHSGQVVEVRARVELNSDTGLRLKGGKFVREATPFFLKEMLIFLDDQKVSEFQLTPALSPNPLIRFTVRPTRSGTLRVVFVNSEGQRAETSRPIRV